MNLMWFRSDLRILDNPALFNAMQHGPTVAVFFLCKDQWDQHHISLAKRSLIIRQLFDLEKSLSSLNVPLIVVNAKTFSRIPKLISTFAKNNQVKRLFLNLEYEWNEQAITEQVSAELLKSGVTTSGYHDQCAINPGQVINKSGGMFKVFSAFKRQYLSLFQEESRALHQRPKKQALMEVKSDISVLNTTKTSDQWDHLWPAGEKKAHRRLNTFMEKSIQYYHEYRDIPSMPGTSVLSPWLAIGVLSTRQCLQAANIYRGESLLDGSDGVSTWINEIIWRDFYRHLLFFKPELCKRQPFKPETDMLHWRHDEKLFEHWSKGETGYPLVDAAMKQLVSTGWMHNRLRMVTAMFLTKHLFIDWRWGEQFFMEHLVDGDFASNNGGWQWSASTGVDAVPYFRIFNPVRQSQRFDPDGKFIRKFLPCLNSLNNKDIHMPSAEQATKRHYPLPIVDHRSAVEETKSNFAALNAKLKL